MPYIIVRSWYPNHKADEVAKKYLEVIEKYPPDESITKEIVPVAVNVTRDGIETLSIDEVETQKVYDALNRAGRFLAEFRNIVDYNYEIKTWAKVEEALDTIGMGG